jgi:hypothetical protein
MPMKVRNKNFRIDDQPMCGEGTTIEYLLQAEFYLNRFSLGFLSSITWAFPYHSHWTKLLNIHHSASIPNKSQF